VCFFCEAPFSEKFSLFFFLHVCKKIGAKKIFVFCHKKEESRFCSLCFCFVALLSSEQKRRRRRTERCSKDDRKKKKRARLRNDTRALWGSLLARPPRRRSKRERKSGVKTENFVTSPFKEKEQYYPQRRLKRRERERDKDE
jgi:hypothetical protein